MCTSVGFLMVKKIIRKKLLHMYQFRIFCDINPKKYSQDKKQETSKAHSAGARPGQRRVQQQSSLVER